MRKFKLFLILSLSLFNLFLTACSKDNTDNNDSINNPNNSLENDSTHQNNERGNNDTSNDITF